MSPAECMPEGSSTRPSKAAVSTPPMRALVPSRAGWLRALIALCALVSLTLAGCDEEDPAKDGGDAPKDRGDFVTEWEPGAGGLAKALEQEELFEELADGLNQGFKLPRDLPIIHAFCGDVNAFYDPESRQLVMCYELLDAITETSANLAADDEELVERAIGTWVFVFFHELGHALVDYYDLPITGREEDAVDDFSAVLMLEADLAEYVAYAADFWLANGSGVQDVAQYADEHSLSEQRFFNILCLIYGSNPSKYDALVSGGHLPEARAVRCPGEYKQKKSSWETLLEPWAK